MYLHPVIQEDIAAILSAELPWSNLHHKRVLVTGASGFLPSYLVHVLLAYSELAAADIEVVALGRNGARLEQRFGIYAGRPGFNICVQDVCAPLDLAHPADIIVHAASQASPKFYGTDPVGTASANVLGTHQLLEAARMWNCEGFLYFSSGEVYGQVNAEQVPTKEDDFGYLNPMFPRSCYAESKRMGETLCASYHHQYGTPAKVVRPFHTYGPGMALDDGRVFADFVADIVHQRDIRLMSDGSARRAFCYLADATVGFLTVLLRGDSGLAYNVGNPTAEVSIRELADCLVNIDPSLGLRVEQQERTNNGVYLASPIQRNSPCIQRMQGLGWSPTTSIAEGFARTVRSFL